MFSGCGHVWRLHTPAWAWPAGKSGGGVAIGGGRGLYSIVGPVYCCLLLSIDCVCVCMRGGGGGNVCQ